MGGSSPPTLAGPGRRDAGGRAVLARSLVHLYWGDLDKVGHVHGCDSWQWGDELASPSTASSPGWPPVPDDCSLTVTADHGMVDVPHDTRLDVADEPLLAAGVRHVTGEARAPQLYVEPGAGDDVHAAWTERLGDRGLVRPARRPWPPAGSARCARRTSPRSVTSSWRCEDATPSSTRGGPGRAAGARRAARLAERRRGGGPRRPRAAASVA